MRFCYARLDGGGGWAPLDEQLGVQRGYTPDCQYFMACFCGRQRYQESLDHVHEVFRADGIERVSMRKACEMTCAVNRGLEQQRQQEITEYLEEDKPVPWRSRSGQASLAQMPDTFPASIAPATSEFFAKIIAAEQSAWTPGDDAFGRLAIKSPSTRSAMYATPTNHARQPHRRYNQWV